MSSRTSRGVRALAGGALFSLLLVSGCADPEPLELWVHLARVPESPAQGADARAPRRVRSLTAVEDDSDLTLRREGIWARLEVVLDREVWKRSLAPSDPDSGEVAEAASPTPTIWRAAQPALALGRPREGRTPYELTEVGAPDSGPRYDADVEHFGKSVGTFTVEGAEILLCLASGELPPERALLSIAASHQELGESGTWLLSGRRVGGEGFAVWPGEEVRLTRRVPPGSVLRFATSIEPALMRAGMRHATHRFSVQLDGEEAFAHEQTGAFEDVRFHALALPAAGGEVEFAFRAEGPFAYTAFLDPVVGPREVGSYGARPAELARARGKRPDVVIFLADTLRADRLGAYGSARELTPNLDLFAATARVFAKAWSVSTHTLPTHSSLFSGLYPRQNGQVDFFNPLPRAVDTLAERLARHGYRTAAVTDGIMVSQSHGMSQGFGVFDERARDLDATLARARAVLAADDGRPLFLFVQTYATHAPYPVRAKMRAHLGDHLNAGRNLEHWMGRLVASGEDPQRIDRSVEGTDEAIASIGTLYDASVVDMDDAFGDFVGTLEELGLLEQGWLVFTSDHGESLGEHDRMFHAGVTYETELRIPLMLRGPGIAPGVITAPVSLIDFTPTIASITGLAAAQDWSGSSLLQPAARRVIYGFQCRGKQSTLAVVDDGRKLIGYEDLAGRRVRNWMAAFDLERDPGESQDLFQTMTPWPSELTQLHGPRFGPLLTPRVESEDAILSGEQLSRMHAMGYAGEAEPDTE